MTETLTHATPTAYPADTAAVWADELDEDLVCVRIDEVTHDVKSFVLESPEGRRLSFLPGQYLRVMVDVGALELERCYTISSSPSRPEQLTITVKRVPGGPVSNWLHDHLVVGDRVRVAGPLGQFTYADHPAAKYLFLSAGSGITPLMSMIRALRDRGGPADVVFVHSARSPADIIFRNEIDAIASGSNVSVATICETDASDERWTGARGRLTLPMLLTIAPDLCDREIFTCGPSGYMSAVREVLARAGVDSSRCHEESFTLEAPPTSTEPRVVDADQEQRRTYAVEFRRSGRTIECDSDTTVLDAALDAGISVPSSCGEGVCGTCKSGLLSGNVDMQHAGGIRPREINDGKVLVCCSTPLDDLVIDA